MQVSKPLVQKLSALDERPGEAAVLTFVPDLVWGFGLGVSSLGFRDSGFGVRDVVLGTEELVRISPSSPFF